jgi:hypothetical protein
MLRVLKAERLPGECVACIRVSWMRIENFSRRSKDDVAQPENSSRPNIPDIGLSVSPTWRRPDKAAHVMAFADISGSPGADTQTRLERVVRFQLLLSLPEVHAVRQRCEVIRCSFRLTCTFQTNISLIYCIYHSLPRLVAVLTTPSEIHLCCGRWGMISLPSLFLLVFFLPSLPDFCICEAFPRIIR